MDEKRVSALFSDAVGSVPAPTFDAGDVAAESARLTRKRNGVVAGSALAFALVVGGVTTGLSLFGDPNGGTGNDSAAMAPAPVSDGNGTMGAYDLPGESATDNRADTPTDLPESSPMQGGTTTGSAGAEPGGTPQGCGTAAREFAAALAGELPAATSPGDPVDSPVTCPAGGRSVALPVADGPRKGLLTLMVVPADAAYSVQPPWGDRPGAQGAVVVAASGKQLVVVIEPVAGSAAPPLDSADTRDIADGLKTQF